MNGTSEPVGSKDRRDEIDDDAAFASRTKANETVTASSSGQSRDERDTR
jgi:hypothetical protein